MFIIASNTFKEIIRDRILYGLIVFAVLLILISLALAELSFAEQARITSNFGLMGIHLSSVILAIFVGSTLVSKEIDKKTILTLLARPISREQFILGKSVGLLLIIISVTVGLALTMIVLFMIQGIDVGLNFVISLYGIVLEALVLLGVSLLFSSFTRPVLVVSFSAGIYLIGHWMKSLSFFADQSKNPVFEGFATVVNYALPDLEKFNWRALVIYQEESLPFKSFVVANLYALLWFVFLIGLTSFVLRRKDFG